MNRKHRIWLAAALLAAGAGYFVFAFGYPHLKGSHSVCGGLEVGITGKGSFITAADVAALLRKNGFDYLGKKTTDLPIADMEQALAAVSFIKKADVYTGIDGILYINVEQRVPVLRIYGQDGGSFYIDGGGVVFRARDARPCRVPIVSGRVPLPFGNDFTGSVAAFLKTQRTPDNTLLLLCGLGSHIADHPLWSAQIEQIHFDTPQSVELVPRVGAHIIKLGSLHDYEYKLRKLLTFYRRGLPPKGWNTYSSIDLSYSNQVVCRRK